MNDTIPILILEAKAQRLGQKKLAEHLEISPQYLSDILSGRRKVSERVGEKIGCYKRWTMDTFYKEKQNDQ